MEEEDLRPVFEEFGEIFDLAVIRDKISGLHRGELSRVRVLGEHTFPEQGWAVLQLVRRFSTSLTPLDARIALVSQSRVNGNQSASSFPICSVRS